MTIGDMCISEGLHFRDILIRNHYCRLSYSQIKVHCKYLGKKDQNDLSTCDFDRINWLEKRYKKLKEKK